MNIQEIQTALERYSKTGLKAASLFGAASDIIKILGDSGTSPQALLTGDPIADVAILRASGVEQVIKSKWNMDAEGVLEFIRLLLTAGQAIGPMFERA